MMHDLTAGPFHIDLDREAVTGPEGTAIRLRPQSFAVLRHLAANAGRIVGKDELAEAVWPDVAVTDDSLMQCIADIRRALGPAGQGLICTLPKRGYLIDAPATAAPPTFLGDPHRPAVAVLPFRAIAGGERAAGLGEGIGEDVIVELSRSPDLSVIARASSFRFADTGDPAEIAAALGVRFLLGGTVRLDGARLRVTAHLVRCPSGEELWAERFDRGLASVFDIQTEIARTVTATVLGRIASVDAPPSARPPEDLAAYELVLAGLRALHRYTRGDLEAARDAFRAAIEREPGYGRPHGLLALTEIYLPWYYGIDTDASAAVAPAERAVALDARDTRGHCALGIARLMDRAHDRARAHFETGLRANANDDLLLIEHARFLMYDDRAEAALAYSAEAMRLNPFHPNWYWNIEGRVLHTLGRFEAATVAFERVANPPFWTLAYLAACAAALGRSDLAAEHRDRLRAAHPGFTLARFARIFPYRNPDTEARFLASLRAAGLP
jgi:TolB-like protein/DNA-binding winged helix-turn-helix (wHTH) protein/Tfp pilus assembly protein PilF